MSELKNHINTYQTNTDYANDVSKDYPNISYIEGTDELKWNKYDPEHIVCVYNVTSTESATKLLNSTTNITYQIIDGVQQQSIQTTYTFDTLGEHIVKYKLSGTYIDNYAFSGCSSLASVTIPEGVTGIVGREAFKRCTNLTSVVLPNSITRIDADTFYQCTSLASITIPSGITYIGSDTFYQCTSLASITVEATTPPSVFNNSFTYTNNCPIYVPAESVDAYKTTGNWVSLASRIQPIS